MFSVIREVCDSSQAVLTAPRQLGARTDDHYRLTVSNANLVVCPSCHTHCGMWRHTSTERAAGDSGEGGWSGHSCHKICFLDAQTLWKPHTHTYSLHYNLFVYPWALIDKLESSSASVVIDFQAPTDNSSSFSSWINTIMHYKPRSQASALLVSIPSSHKWGRSRQVGHLMWRFCQIKHVARKDVDTLLIAHKITVLSLAYFCSCTQKWKLDVLFPAAFIHLKWQHPGGRFLHADSVERPSHLLW